MILKKWNIIICHLTTRGLFKIERGDGRRCDLSVCLLMDGKVVNGCEKISLACQRAAFFIIKETLKKIAPEGRVSKFEP